MRVETGCVCVCGGLMWKYEYFNLMLWQHYYQRSRFIKKSEYKTQSEVCETDREEEIDEECLNE